MPKKKTVIDDVIIPEKSKKDLMETLVLHNSKHKITTDGKDFILRKENGYFMHKGSKAEVMKIFNELKKF